MRRLFRRGSALGELAAGAAIGAGFGGAAYGLDRGTLWVALLFGLWGAALTLLVVLTK